MPTKPNENLIVRKIEDPRLEDMLKHFSSLIDEAVNFGSLVFEWIFAKIHRGDHHIAAFSFYRRSLELLDSISVLIKVSCISPCKVLLRSLFETTLSLEYMTQHDFEQRGKDYILCIKHKEYNYLRKFLNGDPLHREYVDKYKKDVLLKNAPIPKLSNIKDAIKTKETLIKGTVYSDSERSYQAIKLKRRGKNPKWWFNLHDGPEDIYDLADKMSRPAQYEVMYRNWAGYAHGTGSMDEQVEIKEGGIEIPQLRLPEYAEFITLIAVSYGLTIIRTMIQKYVKEKEKDFSQWYRKEMQADYLDLKRKRIIIKSTG